MAVPHLVLSKITFSSHALHQLQQSLSLGGILDAEGAAANHALRAELCLYRPGHR